ncbi:unnamed protein product [Lampetra fluviatilis]
MEEAAWLGGEVHACDDCGTERQKTEQHTDQKTRAKFGDIESSFEKSGLGSIGLERGCGGMITIAQLVVSTLNYEPRTPEFSFQPRLTPTWNVPVRDAAAFVIWDPVHF